MIARRPLVAMILALTVGCGGGANTPAKKASAEKSGGAETTKQTDKEAAKQAPVLAFIAASTKDAIQEIVEAFAKEGKGQVKLNADDSSKLALQIVEAARAHLFISANEKWANHVKDKGFAVDSKVLLGNTLVIVVPKGNPGGVKQPADLLKPRVKRVALAGPTVPAGIYGRQALKKLGVWDGLEKEKRVVSGDNVRAVLAFVERGETDAGLVYSTDARITDKVETVHTFDPADHDPIRYPLVLLKQAEKNSAARGFYEFLQSEQAATVFKSHGFSIVPGK